MNDNFHSLEQDYLTPPYKNITCDKCGRKLKSGELFYEDTCGGVTCHECIKEELSEVE